MPNLRACLGTLAAELVDGPPAGEAYMLNPGDAGLLASLARLPAAAASAPAPAGGASIAAHVDHIRFGFELMNRWGGGEADPWSGADWRASWRRTTVTEDDWRRLRGELEEQAQRWRATVQSPRELSDLELKGVMGSIAHLAYHLGAIRQIDHGLQGPKDTSTA